MNLSEIITTIQMDIGIYKIALPFKEPTETILADVIQTKTVPIFSEHHPYYEKITFDVNKLEKCEVGPNYVTYLLPDVFKERTILWIRRVTPQDSYDLTTYSYRMTSGLVQRSMIATATTKLASKLVPKVTHKWMPPRKLRVYNLLSVQYIDVDIAFRQDKNLQSIEDACYSSFLELAELDCKVFLYNQLKHWPEINSMYGNIALKIEDWQNADSERKSLLDQWNNTSHMDQEIYEFL